MQPWPLFPEGLSEGLPEGLLEGLPEDNHGIEVHPNHHDAGVHPDLHEAGVHPHEAGDRRDHHKAEDRPVHPLLASVATHSEGLCLRNRYVNKPTTPAYCTNTRPWPKTSTRLSSNPQSMA